MRPNHDGHAKRPSKLMTTSVTAGDNRLRNEESKGDSKCRPPNSKKGTAQECLDISNSVAVPKS